MYEVPNLPRAHARDQQPAKSARTIEDRGPAASSGSTACSWMHLCGGSLLPLLHARCRRAIVVGVAAIQAHALQLAQDRAARSVPICATPCFCLPAVRRSVAGVLPRTPVFSALSDQSITWCWWWPSTLNLQPPSPWKSQERGAWA
jgi:hypothetical protein